MDLTLCVHCMRSSWWICIHVHCTCKQTNRNKNFSHFKRCISNWYSNGFWVQTVSPLYLMNSACLLICLQVFDNDGHSLLNFPVLLYGARPAVHLVCLTFDHHGRHQWSSHHWIYRERCEICWKQLNGRFCVIDRNKYKILFEIVNHYFSVHLHVPHCYIDKFNCNLCSYVVFILHGYWMSTFPMMHWSGKYCICEAASSALSIVICLLCAKLKEFHVVNIKSEV